MLATASSVLVSSSKTAPLHEVSTENARERVSELLTNNGFPTGLLPLDAIVAGYLSEEGDFEIHLKGEIQRTVNGNKVVTYEMKLTGKLVKGKITKLKGVSARGQIMKVTIDTIELSEKYTESIFFYCGYVFYPIAKSEFV